MPESLLRLPQVLERTGLRRASLYAKIKQNQFPEPIPLGVGGRTVAWIDREVQSWIDERIAAARGSAGGAQ
jgi:prophage regulatory protein